MVFSSTVFIFIFLPLLLAAYYLQVKNIKYKNFVLLFFSICFYAWGEPVFILLILALTINNWWVSLQFGVKSKQIRHLLFILSIVLNLLVLFTFKYLTFILDNLGLLIGEKNDLKIALPIGISFFTFQTISYLIDVYKRRIEPEKSLSQFMLFALMFPQLVAGPIVRYQTISREISSRKTSMPLFSEGVERFIIGLGKKVILANNLAIVVDYAYSLLDESKLMFSMAWLGAIAYSFQIYFDFSGYSDMAIGLGKMFGFVFCENFDYPYISKSISEFWRRWHISLGTWFRDYVYFPLGGSRCSLRRGLFNLMIVFCLSGLWHGANWTFIMWGCYLGIIVCIERVIKHFWKTDKARKELSTIKIIWTFILVTIGWVFFRADSIGKAFDFIHILASFSQATAYDQYFRFFVVNYKFILVFAICAALPLCKKTTDFLKKSRWGMAVYESSICIIFLISASYLLRGAYNPFIYFNF